MSSFSLFFVFATPVIFHIFFTCLLFPPLFPCCIYSHAVVLPYCTDEGHCIVSETFDPTSRTIWLVRERKKPIKGTLNQRASKPHYEVTWGVSKVVNYFDCLGEPDSLSLQSLTWELAMIQALSRSSTSADLIMFDLQYSRYTG